MKRFAAAALAFLAVAGEARGETLRVAADVAPVHALVARVMEGVGTPDLVIPPNASPHGYAMRPSEAAALSRADVVVWVGAGLTPWFGRALESMAPEARLVELAEVEGMRLLEFREGATFGAHDHGEHDHGEAHHGEAHDDEAHHGDEHAREGADDHGADDHGADDHGADEHADGHHAHGEHDPHLWLDPVNAAAAMAAVALALGDADPANAATYAANAAAGQRELEALSGRIAARLEAVKGGKFVVFHDAYHYFEARFDIEAAGALAIGDASDPGPQRIAEVRDLVTDLDVACVFAEPQHSAKLVDTVVEGSDARTGVLDPLGATLEPGATLYPQLLERLADALAGCLEG